MPAFQQEDPRKGLEELKAAVDDCSSTCSAAIILKVEAMFIQAYRTKLRKTQKELLAGQFAELSGCEGVSEQMVHPALLRFAQAALQ